jgi:outer membrane protein TolC
MTRLLTALLAALSVCPVLVGCLHQAGYCYDPSSQAAAGTSWDALPIVERGHIEPDGETLSAAVVSPLAQREFVYRALAAEPCQCLAVRNADMANLLDAERQGVAKQAAQSGWLRAHREHGLSDIKQTILFNAAEEIRNRNAAAALELYYHLAEAEAKSDLVERSLQILRDVSDRFRDMKKKGLRLPLDFETLARQQIEVQIQQTQLQQAIDQFNSDLNRLLGLHGCTPGERLWPTADFSISSETIDVDRAVAQGLAQRPELVVLREVESKLDARILPAVGQLAKSVNALLGMADQQPRLLFAVLLLRGLYGGSDTRIALEVRRQQLRQQLADRERAVAEEIRQAVWTLATQEQLVALTRQKVRSWETGVRELEDRNKQGLASLTEVAMGKLDGLRARGDLVKEVMAWHIARVRFKQAQGLLPPECANQAPFSCAACRCMAP